MGRARHRKQNGRKFYSSEFYDYTRFWAGSRPPSKGSNQTFAHNPGGYGFRETNDVVGDPPIPYYPPHPFKSLNFQGRPTMVTGTRIRKFTSGGLPDGYERATLKQAYIGLLGMDDPRSEHYLPVTMISDNPWDYLNRAIVRSNPARPAVSLQNFLFELKDLNGQLPSIPSLPIYYAFGIAPFVGDLIGLYKAIMDVDKAVVELNKTYGSPTRRYGGNLATSTARTQFSSTSALVWYPVQAEKVTTRRAWFTSVVKIGYNPLKPPKRFTQAEALKVQLTQQSSVAVWNALPWSWALDWLVDVGSFVEANWQNTSQSRIESICVMIETVTKIQETRGTRVGPNLFAKEFDVRYGNAERTNRLRHVFGNPIPNPLYLNPGLARLGGKLTIAAALSLALSSRVKREKSKYLDDGHLYRLRVKHDNWLASGGSSRDFWQNYEKGLISYT